MPSAQDMIAEFSDRGFMTGVQQADKSPPSVLGMGFMVAQSAVPATVTGTTVETTLANITIPGGLMGPNGSLRLYTLWSMTPSANGKTVRARMPNGADLMAGMTVSGATIESVNKLRFVQNRGAENSQITFGSWGETGQNAAPNFTGATDTSKPWVLPISGQLANAGDFLRLDAYMVEVFPG